MTLFPNKDTSQPISPHRDRQAKGSPDWCLQRGGNIFKTGPRTSPAPAHPKRLEPETRNEKETMSDHIPIPYPAFIAFHPFKSRSRPRPQSPTGTLAFIQLTVGLVTGLMYILVGR